MSQPAEIIINAVTGLIGSAGFSAVVLWLLQSRARKAEEEQREREESVAEIKTATDAWAALNTPLVKQVDAMRAEVTELSAELRNARLEVQHLRGELQNADMLINEAIAYTATLLKWGNAGAPPPPPKVFSPRLRERINLHDKEDRDG